MVALLCSLAVPHIEVVGRAVVYTGSVLLKSCPVNTHLELLSLRSIYINSIGVHWVLKCNAQFDAKDGAVCLLVVSEGIVQLFKAG